jgi:hypothetical protein
MQTIMIVAQQYQHCDEAARCAPSVTSMGSL